MSPPETRFNTEGTKIAMKRWRDKPAATTESVVEFLGVILVPVGDFDDDVGGAVGHGLAAEARLRGDAGSLIELVAFGVGGFVARLQALLHDDVPGGAHAHPPATLPLPRL